MHLARFPLVAFFALAAVAFPLERASAEPPAEPSLLERLSADVAQVAARATAATGRLTAGEQSWSGVVVGKPARFVVALDAPIGADPSLPPRATLHLPGRPAVDATLLQADAALGVAIYAPEAADLPGLDLARAPQPAGSLGVALHEGGTGLLMLPAPTHELEDVAWGGQGGASTLCGPDGRLLALTPARSEVTSCAACHTTTPRLTAANAPTLTLDIDRIKVQMPQHFLAGSTYCPHGCWIPLGTVQGSKVGPTAVAMQHGLPGAVPAAVIARALEDVAAGRRLARTYLGVIAAEPVALTYMPKEAVAPQIVRYFRPGETIDPSGVLTLRTSAQASRVVLSKVIDDSPAARAGLTAGATIVAIDGIPLRSSVHLARVIARRRPGETIRLTVSGRPEPVAIVLGDRDQDAKRLVTTSALGLGVKPLSAELADWLNVPLNDGGLVVTHVVPGGAAEAAGLRRGDVLRAGGGGPLRDQAELDAVVGAARGTIELVGARGGSPLTVKVQLPMDGHSGPRPR